MEFVKYLGMPRGKIVMRYTEVIAELASLAQELATVYASEREAKVEAFARSEANTIAGRERDADLNSLPLTVEAFRLRGMVQALEYEKTLIELLLDKWDWESVPAQRPGPKTG